MPNQRARRWKRRKKLKCIIIRLGQEVNSDYNHDSWKMRDDENEMSGSVPAHLCLCGTIKTLLSISCSQFTFDKSRRTARRTRGFEALRDRFPASKSVHRLGHGGKIATSVVSKFVPFRRSRNMFKTLMKKKIKY